MISSGMLSGARRGSRWFAIAATLLAVGLTIPGTSLAATGQARPAATDDMCPNGTVDSSNVCTIDFEFTGSLQTLTIPKGVDSIKVQSTGGFGGGGCSNMDIGGGGFPGAANGTLNTTAGEKLSILIGGGGATNSPIDASFCTTEQTPTFGSGNGGFGGGGHGGEGGDGSGAGGGGGGTFVYGPSGAVELAAGGGGGEGPLGGIGGTTGGEGGGGESNASQSGTAGGPTDGAGGASTSAPGTAGPAGDPNGSNGTASTNPGNAGIGQTSSSGALATGGAGAGGCAYTDNSDSSKNYDESGGGGGGGYFAGGGGGCGADPGGGGGGGSSFAASNVVKPTFVNDINRITGTPTDYTVRTFNGLMIVSYDVPCQTPLSISSAKAEREVQTGVLTISIDGKVNSVEACGAPTLTIDDTTGTAHREVTNFVLQVKAAANDTQQSTATAHRDLSTGDSCWIGGLLKITQGTGTAKREVTTSVDTLPSAHFETARATRDAKGVSLDVKVLALPPAHACGRAKLEVHDGSKFVRLKLPSSDDSGGELTAKAVRMPVGVECLKTLQVKVIPPHDNADSSARAVRIEGSAKAITRCQKP